VANHQKRSFLVALLAGAAGLLGGSVAYLLFGAATGVIAMCSSWAPRWWADVYFALAIVIPAIGIWAGAMARRSYLWRRGEISDLGHRIREMRDADAGA
jgi:membrane protein implicated in regulation of membrane protease activity